MAPDTETRKVRTACPAHCGGNACGILAHVRGDRIVKVEPADFPDPEYRRICMRGLASLDLTYHKDRLKYPMKRTGERGDGKFERISWDEALDTIAARFKDIAGRYGWRSIGWVLGGPGTGTTKFGTYLKLAALTGSTRVSTFGYGDAALPSGSRPMFGTLAPFELFSAGWPSPKLFLVWGSNPAESSPLNRMRKVLEAKERGAQLVVIEPRFSVTASKADQFIGLKPGTDAALALGMMHHIFKRRLHDEAFIRRHTNGTHLVREDNGAFLREKDLGAGDSTEYVVWDALTASPRPAPSARAGAALNGVYRVNGIKCRPAFQLLADLVQEYPPDLVSTITGVSPELITRLAEKMVSDRPVFIMIHMGLTRTFYGDLATRAVGALATVTGNIEISSKAGHRAVTLNWDAFLRPGPSKQPGPRLGVLQIYEAAISGKPYPVKAVWFSFINFLNQCANTNRIISEVLPSLEFIVSADMFMTYSARYSDIVLPACSYLEFSDLIALPEPYIQLQQKVIEPLYESKSDVNIARELAGRLGLGSNFGGEEEAIDLLLASDDPAVKGITLARLKEGPIATHPDLVVPEDAEVRFSTPSGKIELYVEKLHKFGQALPIYVPPLESPTPKYPLSLIQGHSRYRTHSMFANSPTVLEMNPEPLLDMHPLDGAARGISDGDFVTMYNSRGKLTLKVKLTQSVMPGVVNLSHGWLPEQFREGTLNVLTHDTVNPTQVVTFEPNMAMNDVAVEVVGATEG